MKMRFSLSSMYVSEHSKTMCFQFNIEVRTSIYMLRLRVSVVPTHLIAVRLLHDIGKKIPTSSFELE